MADPRQVQLLRGEIPAPAVVALVESHHQQHVLVGQHGADRTGHPAEHHRANLREQPEQLAVGRVRLALRRLVAPGRPGIRILPHSAAIGRAAAIDPSLGVAGDITQAAVQTASRIRPRPELVAEKHARGIQPHAAFHHVAQLPALENIADTLQTQRPGYVVGQQLLVGPSGGGGHHVAQQPHRQLAVEERGPRLEFQDQVVERVAVGPHPGRGVIAGYPAAVAGQVTDRHVTALEPAIGAGACEIREIFAHRVIQGQYSAADQRGQHTSAEPLADRVERKTGGGIHRRGAGTGGQGAEIFLVHYFPTLHHHGPARAAIVGERHAAAHVVSEHLELSPVRLGRRLRPAGHDGD